MLRKEALKIHGKHTFPYNMWSTAVNTYLTYTSMPTIYFFARIHILFNRFLTLRPHVFQGTVAHLFIVQNNTFSIIQARICRTRQSTRIDFRALISSISIFTVTLWTIWCDVAGTLQLDIKKWDHVAFLKQRNIYMNRKFPFPSAYQPMKGQIILPDDNSDHSHCAGTGHHYSQGGTCSWDHFLLDGRYPVSIMETTWYIMTSDKNCNWEGIISKRMIIYIYIYNFKLQCYVTSWFI